MRTLTGAVRWAVIPCKYNDMSNEDRQLSFYESWFVDLTSNNIRQYWSQMSSGKIDFTGSEVLPWTALSFPTTDPKNQGPAIMLGNRTANILADLSGKLDLERFDGLVLVVNAQFGSNFAGTHTYKSKNGSLKAFPVIVLDNWAWNHGYVAHEAGHAMGFSHSRNNNPVSNDPANDGTAGAYGDPWDIMSYGRVGIYTDPVFGLTGPGLNSINRIAAGWTPPDTTWYQLKPSDPAFISKVILRPLLEASGVGVSSTALVVEYAGSLYSFEYRHPVGWDRGIGADGVVLIHQLTASGASMILPDDGGSPTLEPGAYWSRGRLEVTCKSINQEQAYASLQISLAQFPSPPRPGPGPRPHPTRVPAPGSGRGHVLLLAELNRSYLAASDPEERQQILAEMENASQLLGSMLEGAPEE